MTNGEKFKDLFGLYATEVWAMPEKDFLEWLNTPTTAAEPIKHGRWLYREEHFAFEKEPRITAGCSECGHSMYSKHDTLNYCPNCGARMDDPQTYTINAGEV